MSSIRVTYSGLISLIVSTVAVITGTVFVLIVTRKLSPEDLGLWTVINSLVAYVFVIDPIVSFWSTRQIARGEHVGKSVMVIAGIFSSVGILAYVLISYFLTDSLSANFDVLLLAAALVPLIFLQGALSGIAYGAKPHVDQYGLIVFEVTKIPLGFLFVISYDLGIYGAILAIVISNVVRVAILAIQLRSHLIGAIKRSVIKFWFKMSWLPMYGIIPGFIITLDILIFSSISNSLVGLAYWTAGITIAALVTQSGNFSQAVYPKLVATRKKEFAEDNLRRTLYFAIPALLLSMVFAKPLLHLINPIYADGVIIVYFLTLRAFASMFINFSFNVMKAYEQVDTDQNATFKQYIKSKLFMIPTLTFILSGIYIALLVVLLLIQPADWTPVELVENWSMIYFVSYAPFAIYGMIMIKKNYDVKLSSKSILKYLLIALLSSTVLYYFIENYLTYYTSVWDFVPAILPFLALGGAIYFGLTYLIDSHTKQFLNSIISQLKKKS